MRYARSLQPATRRLVRDWSRPVAGVVVTLILLVPSTALALEKVGKPVAGTVVAQGEGGGEPAVLTCAVSGYDVIIRNIGAEPIASGASVVWSVPFARMEGSHVLTAELEPEGRLFLSGVLGSNYLDPGAECMASPGTQPSLPQ
jgi:hypothetical protein